MINRVFHFLRMFSSKENSNPHTHRRHGQGMVEFALALPIFLLLVFGVIEFGRLLMTFSAVFSAAREAARYGSAVGTSANGMSFFRDCAGMREAAVRVGNLGGVKDDQVTIKVYDVNGGPKKIGTNVIGDKWCTQSNLAWNLSGGDKIEVTVNTLFWPTLPLVNLPGLPVSANSSRTLISDISPMDAPVKQSYELNIILNPPAGGNVTITPNKNRYDYAEEVNLVAAANDGYEFTGWSGDQTGTVPVTFLMYSNRTITANFKWIGYKLIYQAFPSADNTVTVNPPPDMADGRYNVNFSTTPPTYQTVTLTVTSGANYLFTGWTGNLGGSVNPATLVMSASRNVTANFGLAYFLDLSVITPPGGGLISTNPICSFNPCKLLANTVVNLSGTPLSGYHFQQWTGPADLIISPAPNDFNAQITLNGDKSIQATFDQNGFTLMTLSNPIGSGSVTASPSAESLPDGPYRSGTPVSLVPDASPGWTFTGWSGDLSGSADSASLTMNSNKSVTANFEPIYTLAVTIPTAANGNQVTYSPGPYPFSPTATATLIPVAASGWTFTGWSGDLSGTDNPASLLMNTSKTVIANFEPIQFSLSVLNPAGNGNKVTYSPGPYPFSPITTATLIPVAAPGWTFTGWEGDLSGTDNPAILTMDTNKSVTANFTAVSYTLSVNFDPSMATVTMDPNRTTYTYGTIVTVNLTPLSGYKFLYWAEIPESESSRINPVLTVTITENKAYTAVLATP